MDPFVGIEALALFSQDSNTMLPHAKSFPKYMGMTASLQIVQLTLAVPPCVFICIQESSFLPPRVGLN